MPRYVPYFDLPWPLLPEIGAKMATQQEKIPSKLEVAPHALKMLSG